MRGPVLFFLQFAGTYPDRHFVWLVLAFGCNTRKYFNVSWVIQLNVEVAKVIFQVTHRPPPGKHIKDRATLHEGRLNG